MRHTIAKKACSPSPAETFRTPMTVSEIYLYKSKRISPACPRCRLPLDREYQAYCDRCGQALSWHHYKKALVILIP